MKISFDLDGVIANTDKWFFRLLDILYKINGSDKRLLHVMEMDYYSNRELKLHPNLFMAKNDEGFIITARKPKSDEVTKEWLKRNNIELPLIFSDHNGEIDWSDYEKASLIAGKYKAEVINKLGIEVHFDNNPYIIRCIREKHHNVKAVLIGGENL